jgi:hypothetical protein
MMYPHVEHPQLLLPDNVIDGNNRESRPGLGVLVQDGAPLGTVLLSGHTEYPVSSFWEVCLCRRRKDVHMIPVSS